MPSYYFQAVPITDDDTALLWLMDSNEHIVQSQTRVGLYFGQTRSDEYEYGTVYLTNRRIVYIDDRQPDSRRIALDLHHIERISTYSGFLQSSPKITLYLKPWQNITRPSSSRTDEWPCTVCACPNAPEEQRCRLCGTVRSQHPLATSASPSTTTEAAAAKDEDKQGISCKVCTFLNHPSMQRCEMCDHRLVSCPAVQLPPQDTPDLGTVRLSFRQGGQSTFALALQRTLEEQSITSVIVHDDSVEGEGAGEEERAGPGGINRLLTRIDRADQQAQQTMADAFTDLDSLVHKANEMLALAETLTAAPSQPKDALEEHTLATLLSQLDIRNPVTRDLASGDSYYDELAREFSGFIRPLLTATSSGRIMTLSDAYCLFNRARGTALVSPQDLRRACDAAELLLLPIRLRQFASGLLAVQPAEDTDTVMTDRVLAVLAECSAISATGLANLFSVTPALALEQLLWAEKQGQLCRDETAHAVLFSRNAILECDWHYLADH